MTTNVFHLEITTVGEVSSDALSHGGALPAASGTRRSPVAIILPVILLVLFVIGMASGALQDFIGDSNALAFLIPLFFVLILIFAFARSAGGSAKGGRSMGTGGSYVLAMSEKTGKEIVQTLGDFIIDK